ncbi:MAG TPA: L-2-hydroxyglutarate oxidase [Nitrospiraceae bacterium]|nr:L-2-hydroxyglutarate oxidase [Nitrospiraceae bacterium]
MPLYDVAIVGGGIIGLSVGWAILQRHPRARILVLEKERRWGHHQTGNNSGEIHAGIYYEPGSLKAIYCRDGNTALVKFCRTYGIPHDICGKVVVATEPKQLPQLEALYRRATGNGVAVTKLCSEELRIVEPHCAGVAALHVSSTGIVNYRHVAEKFAELIQEGNGDLQLGADVKKIQVLPSGLQIDCASISYRSRFLINCAGLHCDRIATLMGVRTGMRIVPIKGEYYHLTPEKRHLVKSLIYAVPNPRYPFLGAHFNKLINGEVRAGPNAVLTLKREGYVHNFDLRDSTELFGSRAFWMCAASHWLEGGKELLRSFSKAHFVRHLQKLVPDISSEDLVVGPAGVRAQAVMDDGRFMDDFLLVGGPRSIHVCNAPSPAATAAIPIGHAIVDRLEQHGVSRF